MSDLLIAPAYAEIAALKRHFQLLNGSPEMLEFLMSPGVTSAGLQTLLSSPVKLTQFQQFLASPVGAVSLAASRTAMAAVIANDVAMAAVAASSTAMAAVIASSTAMAAVAASYVAMAAVLKSAEASKALYDSDTAWSVVVASATAKATFQALGKEHFTSSTTHVYPTGSAAGVRAVLVGQQSSYSTSYAGANADTYSTTSSAYIDRYVRVTGLTHRTSSYNSSIKYVIMQ